MQCINLTPRWTEILPTWFMIYEGAVLGDSDEPAKQLENARKEFTRMAEAADKFNDLVAWMTQSEGWSAETVKEALALGRAIQERERNAVKGSQDEEN